MKKFLNLHYFFFGSSSIKNFNFFKKVLLVKNNYFFTYFKSFKIFFSLVYSIKKKLLLIFCNFLYSKIFLKVGLGFRKKYSKNMNLYVLSIGRRYSVIMKSLPSCYFFNVRRRSIFFFSNSKKNLYFYLNRLRILRKETVYKYKGIMTLNRIIFEMKTSRSVLFARRVKFKNIILKLTKKQKQKK